jgi:hypothetical protein
MHLSVRTSCTQIDKNSCLRSSRELKDGLEVANLPEACPFPSIKIVYQNTSKLIAHLARMKPNSSRTALGNLESVTDVLATQDSPGNPALRHKTLSEMNLES